MTMTSELDLVRQESAALRRRLAKSSDLSSRLSTDVDAITRKLDKQMKSAPPVHHHRTASHEHLARIDNILNRLDDPCMAGGGGRGGGGNRFDRDFDREFGSVKPNGSKRRQRREQEKWARLGRGGSTVRSAAASLLAESGARLAEEPREIPAVHAKPGLRPRQKTFDSLHGNAAEIREKRERLAQEKAKEEMAMPKVKIVNKVLLPSASTGRLEAREQRESRRQKGLDLAVEDIIKADHDSFAIARARQRKKWAKEKREKAKADRQAATAAARAEVAEAMAEEEQEEQRAAEEEAAAAAAAAAAESQRAAGGDVFNDADDAAAKSPTTREGGDGAHDDDGGNWGLQHDGEDAPRAMLGSLVDDYDVEDFFAQAERGRDPNSLASTNSGDDPFGDRDLFAPSPFADDQKQLGGGGGGGAPTSPTAGGTGMAAPTSATSDGLFSPSSYFDPGTGAPSVGGFDYSAALDEIDSVTLFHTAASSAPTTAASSFATATTTTTNTNTLKVQSVEFSGLPTAASHFGGPSSQIATVAEEEEESLGGG